MPCKNKSEKKKRCQRQHIPENTKKEIGAVSVTEWKQVFLLRALYFIQRRKRSRPEINLEEEGLKEAFPRKCTPEKGNKDTYCPKGRLRNE